MNAASRPNADEKNPPTAAPTANITPHVDPRSEFALAISSRSRARFGMAASVAGFTTAARAETELRQMNASHTVPSPTRRSPSAETAWIIETTTSMRCRSNRSTIGPAIGDARNEGREKATMTSDTRKLEPVRSSTSPTRAMKLNQSPMYEMTWAMKTRRMS